MRSPRKQVQRKTRGEKSSTENWGIPTLRIVGTKEKPVKETKKEEKKKKD